MSLLARSHHPPLSLSNTSRLYESKLVVGTAGTTCLPASHLESQMQEGKSELKFQKRLGFI